MGRLTTIAFDPSTRSTGWSICDGEEWEAGAVRAKNLEAMLLALRFNGFDLGVYDGMVIERPEIYVVSKNKTNPNKLQQLSIVAGACTMLARYERLLMPYPKEWKGSVPKHVTERRTKRELEDQWPKIEKLLSKVPKTSRDDVVDAIALNQWLRRRLG